MTASYRRGFTLVEVLVAVTILAFVISGISMVLIKQTQASSTQSLERDLEENGRLALLDIARSVRLAGYGITPIAAFDFDRYGCTTPGTGSTCPNGGRDRIDGPDEVVLAWRDPSFFRTVTAINNGAGPYTATITPALTAQINSGRVVQLLCAGADPAAYLALSADAAAGSTTLQLRVLTSADGYFPTDAANDACFKIAGLMLVERVRYYVANDTDGVPALFKERGRGGAEKLYRGIEDLQLTYDIGQPPAGSAFAAGGATPSAAPACTASAWTFGLCATAETPSEAATAPDWRNDTYDSANRYTGHPANIRVVTVNVVARSTREAPALLVQGGQTFRIGDGVQQVANRPARAADTFRRSVFTVSEQAANLVTRAHFLPPVATGLNVGGG